MVYRYLLAWAVGLASVARAAAPAPLPAWPRADSLRRALRATRPDTQRVRLLHELVRVYYRADPDTAFSYARREIVLARRLGDYVGQAEAWSATGNLESDRGNFAAALRAYEQARRLAEARGDGFRAAWANYGLGEVYKDQSFNAQASECLLRVIAYYRNLVRLGRRPNTEEVQLYAYSLQVMAEIYTEQKNYGQAERLYRQAIDLLRTRGHGRNVQNSFTGLALLYQAQGRYADALRYHRQALALEARPGNAWGEGVVRSNMGDAFLNTGRYDSARVYLEGALRLMRESGDSLGWATAGVGLARLHARQRQFGLARRWARQALGYAQRANAPVVARWAAQVLADVAETQGDYRAALEHYRISRRYNDSVFGNERRQQTAELQHRFENARHEQQLLAQRLALVHEQKNHNIRLLWLGLLLTAASGLAAVGWFLVRQYRLRAERDRAAQANHQAELRAAQLATQAELNHARHQLDLKHQELTGLTLAITQKGEFLDEVRGQIDDIARRQTDDEARRQLQRLRLNISQQANTEKDWAHFTMTFEQVHHNFFAALRQRHPAITPYELRLAALLKLNLASRDMASVLGISEESVKKARYRLRRKLGLDSSVNLVDFMMGVDDGSASAAPAEAGAKLDEDDAQMGL